MSVPLTVTVVSPHDPPQGAVLVHAAGWRDRDNSLVILVANTASGGGKDGGSVSKGGGSVSSSTVSFKIALPDGYLSPGPVVSLFESGQPTLPVTEGAYFQDSLRRYETRAYRVAAPPGPPVSKTLFSTTNPPAESTTAPVTAPVTVAQGITTTTSSSSSMSSGSVVKGNPPYVGGNMVYNPSYEEMVNPATPDGNYVGVPASNSGTFQGDSRDSKDGMYSLRLHSPAPGSAPTMAPYTITRLNQSQHYTFSVWARGSVGGEKLEFDFGKDILASADGTTSAHPFTVVASKDWALHSLTLVALNTTESCPYGCRSWLSYTLASAGTAWLDVLSIV
jgi:hypothetical protein